MQHGTVGVLYGTVTDVENVTKRPRERRIKPKNLNKNPTARALAITDRYVRGEERWCRWIAGSNPLTALYGVESKYSRPEMVAIPTSFYWDHAQYSRELLARIRGLRGSDLSGTVAEIEEVYDLIRIALHLTRVFLPCMRRPLGSKCQARLRSWIEYWFPHTKLKDLADPKRIAKGLADGVLTHNFVYAPLKKAVEDTAAAVETVALRGMSTRFNIKQQNRQRYHTGIWTVSEFYSGKASVDVYFKEPYASDIYYGNWMEWAWERTSFSFVVDWILDFQSVFAYYGTLDNVSSMQAVLTEKRLRSIWQDGVMYTGDTLIKPGYRMYRSHERKILAPPTAPQLFEGVFTNDSGGSLKSAIALLIQQRSKIRL